jgi:hypothetical protein
MVGRAEEVTLNPVADTCLFEFLPDYNFGAQDDLPAGGLGEGPMEGERLARALFKFDVAAAVPAGATIIAAEMRLRVTRRPGASQDPTPSDFALNRVLVDWGEGTKTGEIPGGLAATAGEATWFHRFYHPDDPESGRWASPGGQFGVDYASAHSAVKDNVDRTGAYVFSCNATGIAAVQSMLDDPARNYGWVLHSLSEHLRTTARRWASREASATLRPRLEITWSLPVAPPEITSVELGASGDTFLVRVRGLAGLSYLLQTSTDLVDWVPGEVQEPSADGEIEFHAPLDGSGFVRVIATPVP